MALEGELRVGLRVVDGRVARVRIVSTRPDVARALLQGRSRAELGAMVPALFSICARSQAVASELACTAAAGEALSDTLRAHASAVVSAEAVREAAWRTLLDWPRALGEPPGDEAIAAARGALALPGASPDQGHAIARAAYGIGAEEWLALQTLPELDRWADQGGTATARFIRRVRDDDAAAAVLGGGGTETVALLARPDEPGRVGELAQAIDADPEFAHHPSWRGAPAETGALARLRRDPLRGARLQRSPSRVVVRCVARLREMALLLAGRASAAVGATALPSGGGIGWAENARGLLVHRLRLEQGRSVGYRIVAPTEWNFHPAGALAQALTHSPATDLDAVRRRTMLLVNSLDPCVTCHVEFDDA